MLRGLAEKLAHPVATAWDERLNSFYVQNNFPEVNQDTELERVEGGFGLTPRQHFDGLKELLPKLRGLAILDNDGRGRTSRQEGSLKISYWRRYEAENYFITPDLLRRFALKEYQGMELFDSFSPQINEVLHQLTLNSVFDGVVPDYETWENSPPEAARIVWEAKTERVKLSTFAEEFFRQLSLKIGLQMLLKKGDLHRLIQMIEIRSIPPEVGDKLDELRHLFQTANPHEEIEE